MSLNQTTKYIAHRLADRIPSLRPALAAVGDTSMFSRNRPMTGVHWRDIPIVINSFNRLDPLRKLIQWLRQAGHTRIFVADNGSTFLPLLDYLKSLAASGIQVIHLGGNYGHKALWMCNLLSRLKIDSEFVYTDPDVVPAADCPVDLVRALREVLREDPTVVKAGPALRLDNIPDGYLHKRQVVEWERQHWLRPVARGAFLAPIDTTFALYRPNGNYDPKGRAIRLGWPYVASHEGWVMDHARLTDEEQYYLSAVRPDISSWSRAPGEGADPVQMKQFVQSERPPLVLNVGCGRDLIPGFINLDSSAQVGADLVFDLDSCRSQKIPLSDDSVDGIYACHVVEHVRDTLALMQELHRVAKPGAQMVIRVPHGSSNDAFEDPTHVHQFFENSFSYFGQPAYRRADYGYRGDWEVSKVALVMNNASLRALPMPAVLRLVQKTRNQVSEMVVYMKAIKPIRGRVDGESRPPLIDVVFSAFASPADFSQSTAA